MNHPPELIPLPCGLVLRRRSQVSDAAYNAAVAADHRHLSTWLPWARQRPDIAETARVRARADEHWEAGESFAYAVTSAAEADEVYGSCRLHSPIPPAAIEIGYWVASAATGRGIATQAAAALAAAAFDRLGLDRVEIHCDEYNLRSAAVPRRLGFTLDRTEQNEIETPAESGRNLVWTLDRQAHLAGVLDRALSRTLDRTPGANRPGP